MPEPLFYGGIALWCLIWLSVQLGLVRRLGKPAGLFWAGVLEVLITTGALALGNGYINSEYPAEPGSWPAVGQGFMYYVDFEIMVFAALAINAVTALVIALVARRK